MKHKYYWSTMTKKIKKYVYTCIICQRIKSIRYKLYKKL